MVHPILMILLLIVVGIAAYYAGKQDRVLAYRHLELKLEATQSVQHNLNCLIGDLRYDKEELCKLLKMADDKVLAVGKRQHEYKLEVAKLKPDALAYGTVKGQWVTDNKMLIEGNFRKECFRCIGYPERRL